MSDRSHITLLKPRETSFGGSTRITTDYLLFNMMGSHERDRWKNRKEFFFATLAFCLGLPSFWRFPKELLLFGSGSFFWLYILFTLLIANSLVFFEVALGQYSCNGFFKVFALCPIFEGLSYSMAFYCVVMSIFYNFLNAIYFIYFYVSFLPVLPYKHCPSTNTSLHCAENSTDLTSSPEYVYFQNKIVMLSYEAMGRMNWRNVGILFFLWACACIAVIKGIRTSRWAPVVYSLCSYAILIAVLGTSLTIEGSLAGITEVFVPTSTGLLNATIWRHALEQSLVSLGLGMGPLITFGSYSKFQSPAHRDTFLICCFVTANSVLSGMVLFSGLGILAKEAGQTLEMKLAEYGRYIGVDTFIIHSQLFTRFPSGTDRALSLLFFLLHCFGGWYSLIIYTDVFNVALTSLGNLKIHYKVFINIAVCAFCFLIGCLLCNSEGYKYLHSLDRYIVGMALIFITLCELIGVIYIYGAFDLCDDIEFMLGVYPNIYYQITWISLPVVLLIFLIYEIYDTATKPLSLPDIVMCSVIVVCILCPVLFRAFYNVYKYNKLGHISQILFPREVIVYDTPTDAPMSLYSFNPTQRNVVFFHPTATRQINTLNLRM